MAKGKSRKRSVKDIVDSAATRIREAAGTVMDEISPSVHIAPEGVEKKDMLLSYGLDNLPQSEIPRIQKDLADGAKIMFSSSLGQADAKEALLALGLDEKYASNVYLVCDDGQQILYSRSVGFAAMQTVVTAPKRDKNGDIQLNKNDAPIMTTDHGKYSFNAERIEKLKNYRDSTFVGVSWDAISGTIQIGGVESTYSDEIYETYMGSMSGKERADLRQRWMDSLTPEQKMQFATDPEARDISLHEFAASEGREWGYGPDNPIGFRGSREEQLFHAKKILDSLVLSPEEKEKYGINFTENGVIIRPISQSIVNAEYTVCSIAGIKPDNVRRVVSHIGQINRNQSINDFDAMFVDSEGNAISAEDARSTKVLKNVTYNMYNPEENFVSIDGKTQNGTWFCRWGLSNRKGLREIYKFGQERAYRINKNIPKTQPCEITASARVVLYEMMQPAYDNGMIHESGPTYFEYCEALQKYEEALHNIESGIDVKSNKQIAKDNQEIIKRFKKATAWQEKTVNHVLNYVSGVPKAYREPKRKRVSSFLHGTVSRDKMPESKLAELPGFLKGQGETMKNLHLFNEYLQGIDEQERAQLSTTLSGYMIYWENKIKKGASEEEILEDMNNFFKSHMQVRNQQSVNANQPKSNIPNPNVPNPDTPDPDIPDPDVPDPDTPEPRDLTEDEERQQYLDQLILQRTIQADQQMLTNIEKQYNGDVEKASQDPNYIYFLRQLESHQNALGMYKELAKKPDLKGIDEEMLGRAVMYSTLNVYIEHYNSANDQLRKNGATDVCKNMPVYIVPPYLKRTKEYQSVASTFVETASRTEFDTQLDSSIHNAFVERRERIIEQSQSNLIGEANTSMLDGTILSSLIENSFYDRDENDIELFTGTMLGPIPPVPPSPQPVPEEKKMVVEIKKFGYAPSITIEQTNKNFNKTVLHMTNADLWKFNKYHGIVTGNIEDLLKSQGYTDGALFNILRELNEAYEVKEGLTQDTVTTYKEQGVLRNFEERYKEICEKYANNPEALKQAKEIFMLEMDMARRLDIYRRQVKESDQGFSFLGKKSKSQIELLGSILEEDFKTNAKPVLAMIRVTSLNVNEYNLFKFNIQPSYEQTEQQFKQCVLGMPLDSYKRSRAFTGIMTDQMTAYMKKWHLDDSKEFEIFQEISNAWDVDPNTKAPKKAEERDVELANFQKKYDKICKKYADDPVALKRARDMFMVCAGQAKVLGDMFQKDNPTKTWETLSVADKEDYAKRFLEQLDEDRQYSLTAIDAAALFVQNNDVKNVARHLAAKDTKTLGETSVLAQGSGEEAVIDEKLVEAKKEEKKSAANKKKTTTATSSSKKKQTNEEKVERKAETVDVSSIAREQLILASCIKNAKQVKQQILQSYGNDLNLARQDPTFKDLETYVESASAELNENIAKNGNKVTFAKKDALAIETIAVNEVVSTLAYNKVIKNHAGSEARMMEQRFNDEIVANAKQKWEQILDKQRKGVELTPEEKILVENTPMWMAVIKEQRVQKQLKEAQARQQQARNMQTQPQQTDGHPKAEQEDKDAAVNAM